HGQFRDPEGLAKWRRGDQLDRRDDQPTGQRRTRHRLRRRADQPEVRAVSPGAAQGAVSTRKRGRVLPTDTRVSAATDLVTAVRDVLGLGAGLDSRKAGISAWQAWQAW